ncbi:MAG TPA: radical SAM protein, partial [Candidatus Obscuribacterales bacterium]
ESLPDKVWDAIPGISWIDAAGTFHTHPPGPRLQDLDVIPSPYLMGLFDAMVASQASRQAARAGAVHPSRQDAQEHFVMLWESNRGCPFSCAFCDWGSNMASKVQRFGLERLKAEIDWAAAHGIATLNCCDANFGMLPRDLEIAEYVVAAHQRTGYPSNFFIQSAKNATERAYAVLRLIIQSGLHHMVTLSLQSVSPAVLKSIRRENISLETYRQLQYRFRRDGVATYTDLLIGLPDETHDSFAEGICRVLSEGQHHWINFYPVYILPNAELAQPDYRRRFGLETIRIPYSEDAMQLKQEVPETQELVIASASYSREDWCRMRCLAWWVQILYYNYKLLQLPLLLLNSLAGIPWRCLFEAFADARFAASPMLQDLHGFLQRKALGMLRGEPEPCAFEGQWLNVPNFIIAGLASEPVARAFFAEAGSVLRQLQAAHGAELPPGLLDEALQLSEGLFLSPVLQKPFSLPGRYTLWPWYQAALRGEPIELLPDPCRYVRDWFNEPLFDVRVDPPVSPLCIASSYNNPESS